MHVMKEIIEDMKTETIGECRECEFFQPPDFCKLLPWNDPRFRTPLAKYQAWQGKFCPKRNFT